MHLLVAIDARVNIFANYLSNILFHPVVFSQLLQSCSSSHGPSL